MENLPVNNRNGQSYGYTLYETTITSGGLLKSGDNVRDRALVSPHSTRWRLTLRSVDVVAIMILDVFVVAETNPCFLAARKSIQLSYL